MLVILSIGIKLFLLVFVLEFEEDVGLLNKVVLVLGF